MPSYPSSIPAIPTLGGSDYPKAEHLNAPNREIEAITHVLGRNPRSISPIVPRNNPQNVARYLDMMAYIVKKMTGATNWYDAADPFYNQLSGGGNLGTIAAATTNYAYIWSHAIASAENLTQVPVPFACTLKQARAEIWTAQPGTGSLVWTFRKNGVDTALTFTHAAGAGVGTLAAAAVNVSFAAGDLLSLKIVNNASSASGQIGSWSLEFNQAG